MPLKLDDKRAIVTAVNKVASKAHSAVATEYVGMTVTEMTDLRRKALEAGVYLRVVRNTLAKRAVVGTDFECLQEALVGPIVLAFSVDDPGAAAKVISDFSKTNKKMVVKAVAIGGKLLPAQSITEVAELPTYDEAVSMLMSVMQAPVVKLVRTLAEPHTKLVRTVSAVGDNK
ncbi:50S ribosomal protein L10 [Thiotrichales bacterium HSG1]|nr:50S ribosomal protein L10 [Thiotrichales bacterium HSG1]